MIKIDISDMVKGLGGASGPKVKLSVSRAINTTLVTGRKELKREISNFYNIKSGDVTAELPIVRAKSSALVGKIMARTSMIPIAKFSPTIVKGSVKSEYKTRKKGNFKTFSRVKRTSGDQGVFVTILKSQGRQRIKSAFMLWSGKWAGKVAARGKHDPRMKFLFRTRRERSGMDFPIGPLKGLSVISAVTNKNLIRKIEPVVVERLKKRLIHELSQGIKY